MFKMSFKNNELKQNWIESSIVMYKLNVHLDLSELSTILLQDERKLPIAARNQKWLS